MLGLPWHANARAGSAPGASDTATNRLTIALSRLERRLAVHDPVTLDGVAEPLPTLDASRVGHSAGEGAGVATSLPEATAGSAGGDDVGLAGGQAA